jgi:hypothetical protein
MKVLIVELKVVGKHDVHWKYLDEGEAWGKLWWQQKLGYEISLQQ